MPKHSSSCWPESVTASRASQVRAGCPLAYVAVKQTTIIPEMQCMGADRGHAACHAHKQCGALVPHRKQYKCTSVSIMKTRGDSKRTYAGKHDTSLLYTVLQLAAHVLEAVIQSCHNSSSGRSAACRMLCSTASSVSSRKVATLVGNDSCVGVFQAVNILLH
jgi:hypothetical protein